MLDREEIEHRDLQEIYLEYMKTEVAGATSAKVL
jgi:hypothetical protein